MRWIFTGAQKQKPDTSGVNPSKQVLALSLNIAVDPKLYRELASNPYSPRSLQIISERFPGIRAADVMRAVAWAEPEGGYDWGFRLLETELQEEELCKQRNSFLEIDKRLVQFSGKYAKQFSQLPKEFVYSGLSFVVFGTTDLAEIKRRFTKNQRRDYKLSIINLIENPKGFTARSRLPNGSLKSVIVAVLLVILFTEASIGLSLLKSKQNQKTVNYQEAKQQVLGTEIQKESKAFPVRLKIPSINVDANVQHVGVSADGEMEVSSNSADVGWFAPGPRPGEKGSAVLAGHFNGENGRAGVFADLHKLKKGDLLYIEDEKGVVTAFVVRESRTYDPGYADEVFSRNDGTYLNLVTCEGLWDEAKRSYSERLVVFADIAN